MPRKPKYVRPRVSKKRPFHLISFPAVFTLDTYMGCNALRWETGIGNKRLTGTRTLAVIVRAALDLGLREIGDPPKLDYYGRLSDPRFKKTRTIIRADQKESLDLLTRRGYSLNLAFNMALKRGLEQNEDLIKLLAFRRQHGERRSYAGETFRLSDAEAFG